MLIAIGRYIIINIKMIKSKKCFRCGKECYGYLCKECDTATKNNHKLSLAEKNPARKKANAIRFKEKYYKGGKKDGI